MNIRKENIKKVVFISENRKAICTEEKIVICDAKGEIEKSFESKNCDFFQVKNSCLLAYVEYGPLVPRHPMLRRNAVILGLDWPPRSGKTTLIDQELLTTVAEIPYPLIYPVALLQNRVIAGLYGPNIASYNLSSGNLLTSESPAWLPPSGLDFFIIDNAHFGVMNKYQSILYTFNVSDRELHFSCEIGHVFGVCSLNNDQIFMHRSLPDQAQSSICHFKEVKDESVSNVFTETRQAIYSYDYPLYKLEKNVCFEELLLLSDSVTLIGRSDNCFYLINTETFSIQKLLIALPTIVQMALTQSGNLMGVSNDGVYHDLDALIFKKTNKDLHNALNRYTPCPSVLFDIIIGYEKSYTRFFKSPSDSKCEAKSALSLGFNKLS